MHQKQLISLLAACGILAACTFALLPGRHPVAADDPVETATPEAAAFFLPIIVQPQYWYLPMVTGPTSVDNPHPADGATRQSLNAYLTWDVLGARFDGATFMIYLEADDPTPDEVLATSLTARAFDPYTFAEDTQYYWQVVATGADGVAYLGPIWTFRTDYFPETPEIGTMVTVPAGEFRMGCDPANPGHTCFDNQMPLHKVYLDAYQIDKFEVTNLEYRACVDAGACKKPRKFTSHIDEPYFYNPVYDYYPVMYVSHWDAEDYCAWTGKRLPSEAEWEKAARGAIDTRPWPWGNEHWDCTNMNRCRKHETWHSARVDEFRRNQSPYGAVNLSGNVFEWVQDLYHPEYYKRSPYRNPVNRTLRESERVIYFTIRGGSYHDNWWYGRVNHRHKGHWGDGLFDDIPWFRSFRVGFRCAQSITEE